MKNKKNRVPWYRTMIVGGAALLLWIAAASYVFYFETHRYEEDLIEQNLHNLARNNANAVEYTMDQYQKFIELTVEYLEVYDEDYEAYDSILYDLLYSKNFHQIALVFPNEHQGSLVTSKENGNELIVDEYRYTEEMKTDEPYISNVFVEESTGVELIAINVPMPNEKGELPIYLVGTVTVAHLSNHFNQVLYDIGGYYHVVDENGNYVAASNANNMIGMEQKFQTAVEVLQFETGYNAEQINTSFYLKTEGISKYQSSEGEARCAYFTPIRINNWIMYCVVDQADINVKAENSLNRALIYLACVGVVFLVLVFWIQKYRNQFLKNEVEYERKFRMVSDAINKFFVEINFEKESVKFQGNYGQVLAETVNEQNLWESLENGFTHPEDIETMKDNMQKVQSGQRVSDCRVRIRNKDDEYIWCALTIIPEKSRRSGKVVKAMGLLENIDSLVQESMNLKTQSEIDLLTGVYNKITTENLIRKEVEVSETVGHHILFIIDIDNFKSINDSFGHQYGDMVIKEVADELKHMFRSEDIVGRIGGDEFFAFMRNVVSKEQVEKRARELCHRLNKTYSKADKVVNISASIGIAFYPEHGHNYSKLYKHADIALYIAKENGKNQFVFYNGQTNAHYVSNRTKIESE